jgi:hypothetical protein
MPLREQRHPRHNNTTPHTTPHSLAHAAVRAAEMDATRDEREIGATRDANEVPPREQRHQPQDASHSPSPAAVPAAEDVQVPDASSSSSSNNNECRRDGSWAQRAPPSPGAATDDPARLTPTPPPPGAAAAVDTSTSTSPAPPLHPSSPHPSRRILDVAETDRANGQQMGQAELRQGSLSSPTSNFMINNSNNPIDGTHAKISTNQSESVSDGEIEEAKRAPTEEAELTGVTLFEHVLEEMLERFVTYDFEGELVPPEDEPEDEPEDVIYKRAAPYAEPRSPVDQPHARSQSAVSAR